MLKLYTIIDPLSKLPESIFSVECKVKYLKKTGFTQNIEHCFNINIGKS